MLLRTCANVVTVASHTRAATRTGHAGPGGGGLPAGGGQANPFQSLSKIMRIIPRDPIDSDWSNTGLIPK